MRGTIADPFRWAQVRRLERAMIPEYERAIKQLAAALTPENLDDAVAIAALPDQVRGYEHLKLERAARYRTELADRLKTFRRAWPQATGWAITADQRGADDAGLVGERGGHDLGADVDVRQPAVGLPAGASADDDQLR